MDGGSNIPEIMFKRLFLIFVPALAALFSSCSSCSHSSSTDLTVPDSVLFKEENKASADAMQNVVENISSPIEIAAMIKNSGVPFSHDYLASTSNVSKYSSAFQDALTLGIFSADMGYLNMYQKTSSMLDYLSAIKTLADAIKIGQFFDFSTLKQLATNNTNLDSLVYISLHNFNQMDKYLRDNNRGSMSSLMISGAWIEGMYILTQVVKNNPNKEMAERVADQKVFIDDLLQILKGYTSEPQFNELYESFVSIKEAYSGVSITYETGEPQTIMKDGAPMIIQNDKSIVNIPDATLKKITETIEKLRNNSLVVK